VEPLQAPDYIAFINAINTVRNGGDNKAYYINVNGTFSVDGSSENTFGLAKGITVRLGGSGTLRLISQGNMLRIGADQTVIIFGGLTLQGLTIGQNGATQHNNLALMHVTGDNAKLFLQNGTISGNTNNSTSTSSFGGGVLV